MNNGRNRFGGAFDCSPFSGLLFRRQKYRNPRTPKRGLNE